MYDEIGKALIAYKNGAITKETLKEILNELNERL